MRIAVPADFAFARSVCSHGWFVLAPNRWDPTRSTLQTVLDIDSKQPVAVRIRQVRAGLEFEFDRVLSRAESQAVRCRVARMLRLDENLAGFHDLCRCRTSHLAAAETRFGRLLRGASLFEDVVKVICTCNVTWRQTVAMVNHLTTNWGTGITSRNQGIGRQRSSRSALPSVSSLTVESGPKSSALFAFPSPRRLAAVAVEDLRRVARLGYRAAFVSRFARDVAEGRLDLGAIEHFGGPTPELHRRLKRIHGVGDYAAANLCMLLGRYDCLAIDTELIRFLRERHPRRRFTPAAIRRYYESWRPYQFLAYWWELWGGYEARLGSSQTWQSQTTGPAITHSRSKATVDA